MRKLLPITDDNITFWIIAGLVLYGLLLLSPWAVAICAGWL